MSFAAEASRLLRRVDVRLGLGLAATMGLLLVGLMTFFFLFSTHENAEVLAKTLNPDLKAIADEIQAGQSGEAAASAARRRGVVAVRRITASGNTLSLGGDWPDTRAPLGKDSSSLRIGLASRSDHWVQGASLPNGDRIELAASLQHFVGERREELGKIGVSLGFGLLGVLAASIAAARLALRPLREATRAAEAIDERNLDARLPVRGSADDLDRHARALNRVLARLEQAFARLSAFSADVAHELRTPVNRMLNLTDVALLGYQGAEPPPSLVGVRESAEQMRRTIDDLLFLARAEHGVRGEVDQKPVDLVELLEWLRELYAPVCEERGIRLKLAAPADRLVISTNRGLLERAVSNLIDNALRHARDGGEVEISLATRGDRIELAVSDSGPGIPEADRERVFDRFVQLDPSRKADGAGLGLPLVRAIARLLGGDARAEASPLGGARLIVTLGYFPASGPTTASAKVSSASSLPPCTTT